MLWSNSSLEADILVRLIFCPFYEWGVSSYTVPDGMLDFKQLPLPAPPKPLGEQQTLQNRGQEQTLDMCLKVLYETSNITTMKPGTTLPVLPSNSTPSRHLHMNTREGSRFFHHTHLVSFLWTFSSTYTLFSLQFPHSLIYASACHLHSVHCWVPGRAPGAGKLLLTFQKLWTLAKSLKCELTTCFSDAVVAEAAAAAATVCLPSPVVLVQSGAAAFTPGKVDFGGGQL